MKRLVALRIGEVLSSRDVAEVLAPELGPPDPMYYMTPGNMGLTLEQRAEWPAAPREGE